MYKVRIVGVVVLALLLSAFTSVASAQGQQTFTLQPGGRATVTFEAFCTDFGQKFPTAIQAPASVAEDNVRGALAYIQNNGLNADETKALEAQYAIWQLRGATGSPAGGDQAKAVVGAASTAPTNPQGTSVVDAAKAGQVRVTIDAWQPIGTPVQLGSTTDNFYGRGTLTVENTSQQALTLYMPVGTQFPPATVGDQTMAGYATNVQVSNPQQSSAPQQLPATAGDNGASWLLFGGALALLAAGAALHMQMRRG